MATPLPPPGHEDPVLRARIDELELRFMEQQRLLEELSAVLYAQQRTVDLASARIDQLEKKLAGEPGLVESRADERPPHY